MSMPPPRFGSTCTTMQPGSRNPRRAGLLAPASRCACGGESGCPDLTARLSERRGAAALRQRINRDHSGMTAKGDSMAKTAARDGGAENSVADRLRALGVKGVLVQMAERGQLLAVKCEMPRCYHHRGRGAFDPVTTPRTKWAPSPDHYPILKSAGGRLVPENVRLAHIWCNNRDYSQRTQIRALLAKGKSLTEIADILNGKGIPRPTARTDGRPRWCARPTCPRPGGPSPHGVSTVERGCSATCAARAVRSPSRPRKPTIRWSLPSVCRALAQAPLPDWAMSIDVGARLTPLHPPDNSEVADGTCADTKSRADQRWTRETSKSPAGGGRADAARHEQAGATHRHAGYWATPRATRNGERHRRTRTRRESERACR